MTNYYRSFCLKLEYIYGSLYGVPNKIRLNVLFHGGKVPLAGRIFSIYIYIHPNTGHLNTWTFLVIVHTNYSSQAGPFLPGSLLHPDLCSK